MKLSPIAKYLTENHAKAYRNKKSGHVYFMNAENELIGRLYKGKNKIQQYSYISIDLFKSDKKPFLSQYTVIEKTERYFLEQHKFMPVKIEIEKTLKDCEHNIIKKETKTSGLVSDRYIEQIKESEELKAERKKLGANVPDNYPVYKINKPFKYEFKAHLYYPAKPIDPQKPMVK